MVALARLLIESGVILPEESPSNIFDSHHDSSVNGAGGVRGRGGRREDTEVRMCFFSDQLINLFIAADEYLCYL